MKLILSIAGCGLMILVFIATNLSSCTKTNTKTVTNYDTVIVKDTITVTAAPSTLSLLTGKQWEFDSVYFYSTGPGSGTLVYARGASNNTDNLDNYFGNYTIEGQYWQAANSTLYLSNYSFTNSDSNRLKIVSTSYGTDYYNIISLSANKYVIYDSLSNVLDIEVPAP
jgi:hypothetical protein